MSIKRFVLLVYTLVMIMMSAITAQAVVDRVTLPTDINSNTPLMLGTYYHCDRGLDLTEDDFIFTTGESGTYSFRFHTMDRVSETIIGVKDRYFEKVFEDHRYGVNEDLIYEYYLDGNETYYLQLYVLNGFIGEVHFDFTIDPPSKSGREYSEDNNSSSKYAVYSGTTRVEGIGDYVGERYIVNCDEWVSLRMEPDASSERVAKVPLGALVTECFEAENGFYLCAYNGLAGYIKSDYLSPNPPSKKTTPAGDDNRYDLDQYEYLPVVEKGRGALIFQKAPRGSFMKNHKFYDGDYIYVNVYWRQDGYAIAYENGEYGYVDASYIDW